MSAPALVARTGRRFPSSILPGLLLCLTIAGLSLWLARWPWPQAHGLGALSLAIGLGMILGNSLFRPQAAWMEAGVTLSRQSLLRLGVMLYGLRLTFQDVGQVGAAGVLIDALVLTSTFGLAAWLGPRWFGLEREAALLIGAGSAICGAAAVMAAGPVLRARAEQIAMAVATVVAFGTLAMFTYPLLYRLGAAHLSILGTPLHFGVFTGSTMHEVAQVVVAGRAIGGEAETAAVITKLVRVMMLAPALLLLSVWQARRRSGDTLPINVPWFAFGFLLLTALNSVIRLPQQWQQPLLGLDELLLATAMAALGLGTHLAALRRAGLRPLLLAAALMAWLLLGGGLINAAMQSLCG